MSMYKVKVFKDGTHIGYIRWEAGTKPAVALSLSQGSRLEEEKIGAAVAFLGKPDEEYRANGNRPSTGRIPVVSFQLVVV